MRAAREGDREKELEGWLEAANLAPSLGTNWMPKKARTAVDRYVRLGTGVTAKRAVQLVDKAARVRAAMELDTGLERRPLTGQFGQRALSRRQWRQSHS